MVVVGLLRVMVHRVVAVVGGAGLVAVAVALPGCVPAGSVSGFEIGFFSEKEIKTQSVALSPCDSGYGIPVPGDVSPGTPGRYCPAVYVCPCACDPAEHSGHAPDIGENSSLLRAQQDRVACQ